MTRAAGAAVGAALGGTCGLALWELFSLHTAAATLTFVLPCVALYALVGAALATSPAARPAAATASTSTSWTSSAACPAVLPGVPLAHDEPLPVAVPRPRVVGSAL